MGFLSEFFDKLNGSGTGITLQGSFFDGEPSKLVISAEGLLDTKNSEGFRMAVVNTLRNTPGVKITAFDLQKLTYISSTGIGAFTVLLAETKKANMRLFLCSIPENIQSIFDNLGFTCFFDSRSSVAEAFRQG